MSDLSMEQNPLKGGAEVPFMRQATPLFFLTGIFLLNFISRIILAPLMPTIETDLRLSHGQAGMIFLYISIGYFTTLLGSGFVSSRLSHRRTIVLSSTAVGLALVGTSMSGDLGGIRWGVLVLGMGAGLYLPSGIATLTSLIHPRHWGKAVAIHELAPNLSFVAAPLLSEFFLLFLSWRQSLALLGGASLVAGLLYGRFGKGGNFHGHPPDLAACRTLFAQPAFWIMIVLFSLGLSGSMGVYTMLPLYLVSEQGIDQNWANTLVALSRVTGPGMSFLGGWASDRFGPRRTMSGVLFLTGMTTLALGVLKEPWVLSAVFLQALVVVSFFPAGFAALSSIGPPEMRNVAISLAVPLAFVLGGGAVPAIIGAMGDAGSFSVGFALVGGLILMGTFLSQGLRLKSS